MAGALSGFAVVGLVVAAGMGLGRARALGPHGERALSAFTFSAGLPALMFLAIAGAGLSAVFTVPALIAIATACIVMAVFVAVGALRRWGMRTTLVGGLASGYVNSSNIGIPLATYILGSATYVTPIMLFQLAVVTPIALTVLDVTGPAPGSVSVVRRITAPLRNPVTLAAAAGTIVSLTGLELPEVLLAPIRLLADTAVPLMLVAFGMALVGRRTPGTAPAAASVLAIALTSVVQPVLAYLAARFVFDLAPAEVFVVVCCALLPAGQNVVNYATRYDAAPQLAQRVVLVSTILAVPCLLGATALHAAGLL